ncbi:Protein of unknown function [Saccharicrinis carchari]|uniref:DUF1573 domain-containing protein n=2 Tax=Saccharicrinis carchari TaxID=1168039 RepID=A0A521BB73_SACCC|nr:Protein of unknown function [Saccharicrinis carchari]
MVLIALGACNSSGSTQDVSHATQETQIQLEKTLHTFGQVKAGETVGCYFNFTNAGNHPLVIDKVEAGCGCTLVKYPKKPLLPGNEGEIEVRFDSRGFSGHQYKVIRIYANIKSKMKELVVTANVIN